MPYIIKWNFCTIFFRFSFFLSFFSYKMNQ